MAVPPGSAPADPWVAAAAAAACGCGAVLALAGMGAQRVELALAGGAAVGIGLVALVAGGWVDGIALVILSVPLPALASGGDVRLAPAAPVTAAFLLAWFVRRGPIPGRLLPQDLPVRSMLALAGAFVLATIAAVDVVLSSRELLNLVVLFLLLIAAAVEFGLQPQRARASVHLLVALAALAGFLAVLEMLGILPAKFPRWDGSFNRAALGFGQPNGLGLFFALCLPFAIHMAAAGSSPTARRAGAVAAALVGAGLLATLSRGSWLAFLLGGAPLLLTRERRFPVRIWTIGLLLAVAADVMTGGLIRETIARTFGADWAVAQRAALMLAGAIAFLENPLTGVGPGGFEAVVDRMGIRVPDLWDIQAEPHNAYIQVAAEAGIPGLLAFLAFLGAVGRTLLRRLRQAHAAGNPAEASWRRTLLWAFGVVCVGGMFGWPFPHGTGQVAVLVMAMGIQPSEPPPTRGT